MADTSTWTALAIDYPDGRAPGTDPTPMGNWRAVAADHARVLLAAPSGTLPGDIGIRWQVVADATPTRPGILALTLDLPWDVLPVLASGHAIEDASLAVARAGFRLLTPMTFLPPLGAVPTWEPLAPVEEPTTRAQEVNRALSDILHEPLPITEDGAEIIVDLDLTAGTPPGSGIHRAVQDMVRRALRHAWPDQAIIDNARELRHGVPTVLHTHPWDDATLLTIGREDTP